MRRNQDQDHWHTAFDLCSNSLYRMAIWLKPIWPTADYIRINVLIFCVLLPIVLFGSIGLNLAFLLGWL